MEFIGLLILAVLGYFSWKQIPPENPEIIAARERFGKMDD